MAGIKLIAQTAEVALAAGVAKTVLQVKAAANHRVLVKGWGVYFDGVSVAAEPVQVVMVRQTSAGTMTSLTPVALGVYTETIQMTAAHTATVEPTTGSEILDVAEVHPQSGYEVKFPLGEELIIAGGGYLGIVITAPAIVNVRAKILTEE